MPERYDMLDELRDLQVTRPPAAGIRARGDRLRRRRTAFTMLAAAAAVAVVAGLVGVVGSPARQVQPAPAPATTAPPSEPTAEAVGSTGFADFPLGAGLPNAGYPVRPWPDPKFAAEVCDKQVFPVGDGLETLGVTQDQAGVADRFRGLVRYGSARAADQLVETLRAAVQDCWSGRADNHGYFYETIELEAGTSSYATLMTGGPDPTVTVYYAVSSGDVALFGISMLLDPAAGRFDDEIARLAPVFVALDAYSAAREITGRRIPEGFPLAAGLPDDGTVSGPTWSGDSGGGELRLCGRRVYPLGDEVESLSLNRGVNGEDGSLRVLAVYDSAAAASELVLSLESAAAGCAPGADGSFERVPFEAAADAYAVAFRTGAGPTNVWRAVTVGAAALVTVTTLADPAAASLADEAATGDTVVDAMCAFAEAGCG